MYDALTSRYTFSCPRRGESRVSLSAFRTLEPLAGTAHPVVFQVRFACPCGDEHDGLVSHDELDWAPLGLEGGVFLNLMTSRVEPVSAEHVDVPFHNDREVGVVGHVFPDDLHAALAEFRAELWSTGFDARRLELG